MPVMSDGLETVTMLQREAGATSAALKAAERAVAAERAGVWSKIIVEVVPDISPTTLRVATHLPPGASHR